ncbi:unnamed protein product [Cuscuta europaea]|uniref:Uncharacterized protein n=1 Tax=Cuscuta europaea TaxID=41803 RepID=A0A9P0ZAR8_CUSEU|nr:unnamed protein product [Cuscuta europaea]
MAQPMAHRPFSMAMAMAQIWRRHVTKNIIFKIDTAIHQPKFTQPPKHDKIVQCTSKKHTPSVPKLSSFFPFRSVPNLSLLSFFDKEYVVHNHSYTFLSPLHNFTPHKSHYLNPRVQSKPKLIMGRRE